MMFENRKGRSKMEYFFEPIIALFGCFVPKSVQKCDRTSHAQKPAARTHIAHTVLNPFRTHFRTHIARAEVRFYAHVRRNPTSGCNP